MLQRYRIMDGKICEGTVENCSLIVCVNPDEHEKGWLVGALSIDEHTLSSSFDPDELARLEFEPEHVAFILKSPRNYSAADEYLFRVGSLGVFLFRDRLVIVTPEALGTWEGKQFQRISSLLDFVLRLLYRTTQHYLEHLRVINQVSTELEGKLQSSMENRHLLNLFAIEKSMVYYHSAIHSNGVVIEKIKANAARLGLTPENIEYLDDLVIENNQCLKQAEIYSNIFASLMDARASIVNNNLSVLIKRLTIINVVFLPLNFLAGVGGMSEYSMMTMGIPWWVTYPAFVAAMLVIAFITYSVVSRLSYERMRRRRRGRKQL